MAFLQIEVDDHRVLTVLAELSRRAVSPGPAMKAIGIDLSESTQQRFGTSTGPDGARWAPNSPSTILAYLGVRSSKKPLVAEGNLASTIDYQVLDGGRTLLVGSPEKYAAVQQFGAKKHEFKGKAPWGDIPARPFLGLSVQDRANIIDTISDYLLPPRR